MAHVSVLAKFICSYEGWGMSDNSQLNTAVPTCGLFSNISADFADVDISHMNEVITEVILPDFWYPCMGTEIASQSIANILVDWYWEAGNYVFYNLRKYFKLSEGGMDEDLLTAINKANEITLFYILKNMRQEYYETQAKLSGKIYKIKDKLLGRLDKIRFGVLILNTITPTKLKFKDRDYGKYIL